MNAKKTSTAENKKDPLPPDDIKKKKGKSKTPKESGEEKVQKDPLEGLKEELAKKEDALADQRNKFLLFQADTENFKKRLRKEKEEFAQFANEKLIKELIPIQANLERALSAPNITIENLKEGVQMILKQFVSFLGKEKVEPMEVLGKKFDPSQHEVLNQMESDEHEDGTIVEEYAKGYFLNGRVLLPAKVVIAKNPAAKPSEPTEKDDSEDEKQAASTDSSKT